MLEGSKRAGAVGIELAMPTVVQAQNIAAAASASFGTRVPLCVFGDGLHAANQPFRRPPQPIARNERPHDRFAAKRLGRWYHPRIAIAIGRTKPLHGSADGVGNGVVAEPQFDGNLSRAELEEVPVCFRVVAEGVSPGGRFFHEIGAFADEPANQKKRGLRPIAVQQVQESWSDGGIGAIVKGNRQLARRVGAANRWSEELRARKRRAIGGQASRGKHGGRHGNQEGVHAAILA